MISSIEARTGQVVADVAAETTPEEVDRICRQAEAAFGRLSGMGRAGRAAMLEAMAGALEGRRAEIVTLADRESALGDQRLNSELSRTTFQLRFFAEVLRDGGYLEATIDHPRETPMGPQPDLRRLLEPLGPVAVFGASNFPLAFSVPGGDTASALAAGCPVVVKAHDAHPATSVRCWEALADGAARAGAGSSVVSLVFGEAAGVSLVEHAAIRAVGFTGSLAGGRYLYDLASRRPSPVPFYGELGALNAVVVGATAASTRPEEIGAGLAASFTLGVGQFCTKPGLVFVPEGPGGDALRAALVAAVRAQRPAPMLAQRIAGAFSAGLARLEGLPGVQLLATTPEDGGVGGWPAAPAVLEAPVELLGDPDSPVLGECFGPVVVVVGYESPAELLGAVEHLRPALTATVHAEGTDLLVLAEVLACLQQKAGRIVWNGFPTGVAVSWAMHHGGPYPATTDPLHTSVGAAAIRRWLRPVCFQNVPQALLPAELRDHPGEGSLVPRRVDGHLVVPPARA